MQAHQFEFGNVAETYLAEFLQVRGWEILARNYRQIGCELDIVARKLKTLAIIEVKHRRSNKLVDMDMLLPLRKRRSLAKGARCFLTGRNDLQTTSVVRFDLAVVVTDPNTKNPRLVNYWPGVFDESNL